MYNLFLILSLCLINSSEVFIFKTPDPFIVQYLQIKTQTIEITVEGMSCQKGCADSIDRKLRSIKGIVRSRTKFDMGISKVTYNPKEITIENIIKTIESLDFKVKSFIEL